MEPNNENGIFKIEADYANVFKITIQLDGSNEPLTIPYDFLTYEEAFTYVQTESPLLAEVDADTFNNYIK